MPTVFFCRRGTLLYCCISCKKYMTGGPTEPKLTSICPLVCLSLVYVLFISPSRACLVFAPHDIPNAHAPSQIQYKRIFSPPIFFSLLCSFFLSSPGSNLLRLVAFRPHHFSSCICPHLAGGFNLGKWNSFDFTLWITASIASG